MAEAAGNTAEFTWTAHPATERSGAAVAGLGVVAAIAAAVFLSFESVWWSLAAVVFLLLSLNRFYFPSRFCIDDDGITARFPLTTRRLSWSQVRRFVRDERGGYLSTRGRRSWLDAYGGLHVLFGDDREAVVERIRERLDPGDGA